MRSIFEFVVHAWSATLPEQRNDIQKFEKIKIKVTKLA